MSYATELTTIKRLALQTLFAILQTATDPAERRRTATAILRIPDPKPDAHPPGMSESGGTSESRGCATPTISDAADPDTAPQFADPSLSELPDETNSPHADPTPESEGLIVSPRAVERGFASDTPGSAPTIESHPNGVLVPPAIATPIDTTPHPQHPALAAPSG